MTNKEWLAKEWNAEYMATLSAEEFFHFLFLTEEGENMFGDENRREMIKFLDEEHDPSNNEA